MSTDRPDHPDDESPSENDQPEIADFYAQLEDLEEMVDSQGAREDVRVHRPIFGLVPRRLVGAMSISFLIAVVMMTGWGRVSWTDPWVAVCTVSVAFVPVAIGSALGDILPGS